MKGVSSEGLSIAVQPAARAAPALRVAMARGKFHCTQIKQSESAMKQAAEEVQTVSQYCAVMHNTHDIDVVCVF